MEEKKEILDDSVSVKEVQSEDKPAGTSDRAVVQENPSDENIKKTKAEEKKAKPEKKTTSVHLTTKHKLIIAVVFLIYIVGCGCFLITSCIGLYKDKTAEEGYWESALTTDPEVTKEVDNLTIYDPTIVTVGTYIITLKDMNLDDSDYEVMAKVWFKWEGDPELDMADNFTIYKGVINKMTVLEEMHEGNTNYQLVSIDTTIAKSFWTVRFPLESHQLRMYVQSNYDISRVRFQNDEASFVNSNLDAAGFKVLRSATAAIIYKFDSSLGNPNAENDSGSLFVSEQMTQIEINRDGSSLYLLCFIAMFGTTIWALIALFICTYHRVDPLMMIPAALFGMVSNIMVGANKVPSMQHGLLLEMNIFGIATILVTAITIIIINRIRSKYEDRLFAMDFGRTMFITELIFVLAGNLVMPLSAYLF